DNYEIPIPEHKFARNLFVRTSDDLVVLRVNIGFDEEIFIWDIDTQQLTQITDNDFEIYWVKVSGEHVVWYTDDTSTLINPFSLWHWHDGQLILLSENPGTRHHEEVFALHEGYVLFVEIELDGGDYTLGDEYDAEVYYWHDGQKVQMTDNTVIETNLAIYVRPDVDVTITPPIIVSEATP
ncbi:MAG: hypothetical protein AAFR67_16010, partial [Chloroflexota bacterium]